MSRNIIALFLLLATQGANAASADRPLAEQAASAPTERQPTTKTPGGFIPRSLTTRTKLHPARMFRAGAAIVRLRPWSRGAFSLMADGFATNLTQSLLVPQAVYDIGT